MQFAVVFILKIKFLSGALDVPHHFPYANAVLGMFEQRLLVADIEKSRSVDVFGRNSQLIILRAKMASRCSLKGSFLSFPPWRKQSCRQGQRSLLQDCSKPYLPHARSAEPQKIYVFFSFRRKFFLLRKPAKSREVKNYFVVHHAASFRVYFPPRYSPGVMPSYFLNCAEK